MKILSKLDMKYDIVKLSQEQIGEFLTDRAQQSASGYFENLARGQEPTRRTPLYKNLPSNEVFDMWVAFLKACREEFDLMEPLIDYDLSRLEKCGPQGGLKPLDDRLSDLFDYWELPSTDNILFDQEIIDQVRREILDGARDRRPLSVESVVDRDKRDDKLITNSGSPDFAKRNDASVLNKAIEDAKSGKWIEYPMILGSRSQRQKERFIFLAPFATNIVEKQYLYPLMDHIRSLQLPFFAAFEGQTDVEAAFWEDDFFNDSCMLVQQDFKAMDKHFNSKLGELVYLITKDFYQERYQKEWYKIIQHVFNIPVMIKLDKLVIGKHGLPSGSGLTNFLESITSYYLFTVYKKRLNDPYMSGQGLGDDMVFHYPRHNFTEEEVKQVMIAESARLGLVLSPEKQRFGYYTTIYLQRFYDSELERYDGFYPSMLAINTAMFPERFHDAAKWSAKMETLRWIMILENCKHLPYRDQLILFFMKGDKYRLGLDIPDFFRELPIIYEESKSIKGFVPSYTQEGRDRKIMQFETVKFILSQRGAIGN